MRTFTVEDVQAIRQTRELAIDRHSYNPLDETNTPSAITERWHDLNSAQLFAICHSSVRDRLTDEQIAAKLSLLKPGQNVGEVWSILLESEG